MMSINVLIYGFMAPVSGTLSDKWKPRIMMPVGATIIAFALVGCSLADQIWHFYIFFGVFVPVGTAMCGWPIISPALMNWFVIKRGLVLGLGQVGVGLSLVYGLIAEYLIVCFGWRNAYLMLAGILIVILIPLHRFFFHYRPESMGLRAYGSEGLNTGKAIKDYNLSSGWTIYQMLHAYQLWFLILSKFLYWGISCFLVLAHQIKFAEDVGYSSEFSVAVFAFFGVAMLIGQSCGVISDRVGREKVIIFCSVLAVGGLLALISVRDVNNPWLLYIYALSFGYGAGLFTAVIYAGAADIFHGKHFGTVSGLLLTGMGLGGAIGPWLGGYLYDISGSYDAAFTLCIVCLTLASITFWIAAPRNAKELHTRLLRNRQAESPCQKLQG